MDGTQGEIAFGSPSGRRHIAIGGPRKATLQQGKSFFSPLLLRLRYQRSDRHVMEPSIFSNSVISTSMIL